MELPIILSPEFWLEGTPGEPSATTYALLGLFSAILLTSLAAWLRRRQLFPGSRPKIRLVRQVAPWFVTFSATGCALLALRLASSPILTARWLWLLSLVGVIGVAAYTGWYWRRRLPSELAAFEKEQAIQPWLPRPRPRRRRRR